jgi:ABC-2 type transport system ATP-binding protein
MQLSGCHAVEGVPVSRLSGGYQRRANVAAALMNEPDLLVLDEPTAGLDADGRNQVAAVVSSLRQAGATVMLVTHDFEIAETIADRIGILTEGVLCCLGELNVLIGERLGERERVEFILKEPPGLERRARLAALGARSTPEGRAWRVWRRLSNFDTAVVAAELAEAGLQVAEIRVRKPGLADLFAATTGEGQAA